MSESKTPRTEDLLRDGFRKDSDAGVDDLGHYMANAGRLAHLARQLETELAAANARIAELEKTIRALVDDGWLAHGPEGMSDVQKSLYEAIRGDGA